MTLTIEVLFAVIVAAVIVALVIVIVIGRRRAGGVNDHALRAVGMQCATNGHAYEIFETGWRCVVCGNHVPRAEGEAYGPAKDGLRERRREDR